MGVPKNVQNISESTGARRKAEFWPPAPSKAWWYKNCKVQASCHAALRYNHNVVIRNLGSATMWSQSRRNRGADCAGGMIHLGDKSWLRKWCSL